MANDTQKSNNHRNIYVAVAVILLLAAAGIYLRGCGNDAEPTELHQRTDAAVDSIERQHEAAGRELDIAGTELDSAEKTVQRADGLVDRSQKCVIRNAESVIKCQQIVSESRKIVADSQRIYAEVEKANRSRAGSGSGS